MPDVPQDARKAAADPVLLPADGCRWATAAWDAWDAARRAARAVAQWVLPGADAEKLAAPEPGGLALAGLARSGTDALVPAAEPGRQVEGQSAA